MTNILDLLKNILSARYGKDVRQSIHDAIKQCYEDGKAGTIDVEAREQIAEVEAVAKGRTSAISFENYEEMFAELNAMDHETLKRGWNIYIATLNVPDLWVYRVEETSLIYTYSSDDTFVDQLKEEAVVQVGFYKLAALETAKVDLSEYVKLSVYEAKIAEIESNVSDLNENYTALNRNKVGFPDYSNRKKFASGDKMTEDGFVRIGVRASENRFISITVNDVVAYMGGVIPLTGSSNYDMSPLIPVKAGDVVTFSTNVTEASGTQFGSIAHFFALRK